MADDFRIRQDIQRLTLGDYQLPLGVRETKLNVPTQGYTVRFQEGKGDGVDFRALLACAVRSGGLNLRNPVAMAADLHVSSKGASDVLVASLLENGELDSVEHKQCVRHARTLARNEREAAEEGFVKQTPSRSGSSGLAKREHGSP